MGFAVEDVPIITAYKGVRKVAAGYYGEDLVFWPGRAFKISPAVSGKALWDLDEDGPLTLSTVGSWEIIPGPEFAGVVDMNGPGGSSGGLGASAATNGGAGSATTFGTLSGGPGAPSNGAITNTATSGGAGGTASGGDTNTAGSAGTAGTTNGFSNGTGGSGGASPNGGATRTGPTASGGGGGGDNQAGIAGNTPGGGAAGGARWSNVSSGTRRYIGGGGGGARCIKTYSAGDLPMSPITIVVSDSGAAGTGDYAAGAKGAAGRVVIT
ncbi:hypothetical protein FHS85_002928 [Rhodoligotrophos appendicifer]|uniref:hypothetical protein n=1 Tax=Rhodoligotrophos appendicifer TaxID=987056 RepID=UPI00118505B5|nr:hypothetical protein [Rhodoligotrophos appendicifer]